MNNKKTANRKAIIWSIVGALAVVSILAFFILPRELSYTEIVAKKGNLATNYSFSGSVEAKKRQTVFADKAMQIKDIKVKEGEAVSTETVLMTTAMGEELKPKIVGEVSSIYVDENAQLMPGTELLEIVDYSDLQLKVQVDEYDLSAVSKGKDAIVTIHSLNKEYHGKIIAVSKEGEYASGVTNFVATISLANDGNLRVGMSAEATVLNESVEDVVLLPMAVIQFDTDNNPYVLIKDNKNSPKTVEIIVGINDGVQAEIKSGVLSNDKILVPSTKPKVFDPGAQIRHGSDETHEDTRKVVEDDE